MSKIVSNYVEVSTKEGIKNIHIWRGIFDLKSGVAGAKLTLTI